MSVFPQLPLGLRTELRIGTTWTDISGYLSHEADIAATITTGRADGAQAAQPATSKMRLNNQDGRFAPRNPAGAWYGQIGRNTPLRHSVPDAGVSLRFADDDTSSCATPSSAALNPAGDLDIRADARLASHVGSVIASKYAAASDQRSWALWVTASGQVAFGWSSAGTFATWTQVVSTALLPLPLGRVAVRATLAVATGTVTLYTAATIAGPWTVIASGALGATSVFASAAPVVIGANADLTGFGTPGMLGRVFGFRFLSGIGGTTLASPDFTAAAAGAASETDAQGNVWTVAGTAEFSGRDYQFHGECAALPQTWDPTGHEVWTPVTAAGILRRLGQASVPVQSAFRRAVAAQPAPYYPVAYWPMEDGAGAAQFGSATGSRAMNIAGGPPTLASDTGFACSNPLPVLNGAVFTGTVPPQAAAPAANVLRFLTHVPAGGDVTGATIARLRTGGRVAHLDVVYTTGGALNLTGYDPDDIVLFTSGVTGFAVNGALLEVSVELTATGWALATLAPGATTGSVVSGAFTNTLAQVTTVTFNPGGLLTGTAIGHAYVQPALTSVFALGQPLNAWRGEPAGARFARLCAENGIAARVHGWAAASAAMGYQVPDILLTLLQECEDSDQGMVFDPRDGLGLGYRTLSSLCSQSPSVSLDLAQDHIAAMDPPLDDDQYTRNDITVSRTGGTTVTTALADGSAMSTGNPPGGVGDYGFALAASLNSDSQAADLAGWVLHGGTVDEPRYPGITVDLANAGMSPLFYPVLDTEHGDYVSAAGLPSWLPPGPLKGIVWGAVKELGNFVCRVTWQTQPESAYEVAAADDAVYGRPDTDGSSTHSPATSTATSLTLDSAAIPWTAAAADYPFDVVITGEQVTLTGVTDGPRTGVFLSPAAMGETSLGNAVSDWQAWTGLTVRVTRAYFGLSSFPIADANLSFYAANGIKACLNLEPAYSPTSATDLSNLAAMLAYWQGQGLAMEVSLWAEPLNAGLTSAQFLAMIAYYGPTVRAYCPLVFCCSALSVQNSTEGTFYPGDNAVDKITADLYAIRWLAGVNLDAAMLLSPGKPFGIWEFGASPVGVNWLTGDDRGFEGSAGNWTGAGNATVARSAAAARTGAGSLAITSVAAGNATAASCAAASIATLGLPCAAGDSISCSAWLKAAAAGRSCAAGATFYDATNTPISTLLGTAVADTTAGMTQVTGTVTAPANAAHCRLAVQVQATGAAGETHYADDCSIGNLSVGQTQAQIIAFCSYIQQYMSGRARAGRPVTDVIMFNSGAASGAGIAAPVTYDNQGANSVGTSFRVPLFQAIYQAANYLGSPQTFSCVRSVNGVVKAHSAGEDVRLFFPPVAALI